MNAVKNANTTLATFNFNFSQGEKRLLFLVIVWTEGIMTSEVLVSVLL